MPVGMSHIVVEEHDTTRQGPDIQNSCVPSQGRHTEGIVWTPWTHLWPIPVHDNNVIKTLKLDSKYPKSLWLHKKWRHRGLCVTTLSESYFSLEPPCPSLPWLTQGNLANQMDSCFNAPESSSMYLRGLMSSIKCDTWECGQENMLSFVEPWAVWTPILKS